MRGWGKQGITVTPQLILVLLNFRVTLRGIGMLMTKMHHHGLG